MLADSFSVLRLEWIGWTFAGVQNNSPPSNPIAMTWMSKGRWEERKKKEKREGEKEGKREKEKEIERELSVKWSSFNLLSALVFQEELSSRNLSSFLPEDKMSLSLTKCQFALFSCISVLYIFHSLFFQQFKCINWNRHKFFFWKNSRKKRTSRRSGRM